MLDKQWQDQYSTPEARKLMGEVLGGASQEEIAAESQALGAGATPPAQVSSNAAKLTPQGIPSRTLVNFDDQKPFWSDPKNVAQFAIGGALMETPPSWLDSEKVKELYEHFATTQPTKDWWEWSAEPDYDPAIANMVTPPKEALHPIDQYKSTWEWRDFVFAHSEQGKFMPIYKDDLTELPQVMQDFFVGTQGKDHNYYWVSEQDMFKMGPQVAAAGLKTYQRAKQNIELSKESPIVSPDNAEPYLQKLKKLDQAVMPAEQKAAITDEIERIEAYIVNSKDMTGVKIPDPGSSTQVWSDYFIKHANQLAGLKVNGDKKWLDSTIEPFAINSDLAKALNKPQLTVSDLLDYYIAEDYQLYQLANVDWTKQVNQQTVQGISFKGETPIPSIPSKTVTLADRQGAGLPITPIMDQAFFESQSYEIQKKINEALDKLAKIKSATIERLPLVKVTSKKIMGKGGVQFTPMGAPIPSTGGEAGTSYSLTFPILGPLTEQEKERFPGKSALSWDIIQWRLYQSSIERGRQITAATGKTNAAALMGGAAQGVTMSVLDPGKLVGQQGNVQIAAVMGALSNLPEDNLIGKFAKGYMWLVNAPSQLVEQVAGVKAMGLGASLQDAGHLLDLITKGKSQDPDVKRAALNELQTLGFDVNNYDNMKKQIAWTALGIYPKAGTQETQGEYFRKHFLEAWETAAISYESSFDTKYGDLAGMQETMKRLVESRQAKWETLDLKDADFGQRYGDMVWADFAMALRFQASENNPYYMEYNQIYNEKLSQLGAWGQWKDLLLSNLANPMNTMPFIQMELAFQTAKANGNMELAGFYKNALEYTTKTAIEQRIASGEAVSGKKYNAYQKFQTFWEPIPNHRIVYGEYEQWARLIPMNEFADHDALTRQVAQVVYAKDGTPMFSPLHPGEEYYDVNGVKQKGVLVDWTSRKGFKGSMFNPFNWGQLTPDSQVLKMTQTLSESIHLVATELNASPTDLMKMMRVLKANDPEQVAKTINFYTPIKSGAGAALPMVLTAALPLLEKIYKTAWEAPAEKRTVLNIIQDAMKLKTGDFIDLMIKKPASIFDQAKLLLVDPEFKKTPGWTVLNKFFNGKTPQTETSFLKMLEPFAGYTVNKAGKKVRAPTLPMSGEEFNVKFLSAFTSETEKYLTNFFNIHADPWYVRTTQIIKNAQSLMLLALNPMYAIRNGFDNIFRMAWTDALDMSRNHMNFVQIVGNLFGFQPPRLRAGIGGRAGAGELELLEKYNVKSLEELPRDVMGEVESRAKALTGGYTIGSEIAAAKKINDGLESVNSFFRKLNNRIGFASKWAQKIEQISSENAYVTGALRTWTSLARVGPGGALPKLPEQVESFLSGLGLLKDVYSAVNESYNIQQIKNRLYGNTKTVNLDQAFSTDQIETLKGINAWDPLVRKFANEWDGSAKGAYKIIEDTLFESVKKQAQNEIERLIDDHSKKAEAVVASEGIKGAISIWNNLVTKLHDRWTNHQKQLDDLFEQSKGMSVNERRQHFENSFKQMDAEWRSYWNAQGAEMMGMFRAMGIEDNNPLHAEYMSLFISMRTNWDDFFTSREQIKRWMFDAQDGDKGAQVEFLNRIKSFVGQDLADEVQTGSTDYFTAYQKYVDQRYQQAFILEDTLQTELDAFYAKKISLNYPGSEEAVTRWLAGQREARQLMNGATIYWRNGDSTIFDDMSDVGAKWKTLIDEIKGRSDEITKGLDPNSRPARNAMWKEFQDTGNAGCTWSTSTCTSRRTTHDRKTRGANAYHAGA